MERSHGPGDSRLTAMSPRRMKRHLTDKAASVIVTIGGWTVILSMIAIVGFIILETYPLWRSAGASLAHSFSPDTSNAVAIGQDDYRETVYLITPGGEVVFYTADGAELLARHTLEGPSGAVVRSAVRVPGSKSYALATTGGSLVPVDISYRVEFSVDGERVLIPVVEEHEPVVLADGPLRYGTHVVSEDGLSSVSAAITGDGRVVLRVVETVSSLFEGEKRAEYAHDLTTELKGRTPTVLVVSPSLDDLYIGTTDGMLIRWSLRSPSSPRLLEEVDATEDRRTAITALGHLLGGVSLVVGDGDGSVSVWFPVRDASSALGRRLVRAHEFPPHPAGVTGIAPSLRNKGFATADALGNVYLNYSTSGARLLELAGEGSGVTSLALSPRADGIAALDASGRLREWEVNNPHPEVTLRTLFGKVWYEGYTEPQYVWQSTGGTDEFEPKLSLTPLIFGTIKGTVYSLFFAIPLGILSALCVSQFMHPSVKTVIKPVVELMAAMPSVVLGFLAGLWLAPLVEGYMPGIFLLLVVFPFVIFGSVLLWSKLPRALRHVFRDGTELFLLIPVILLTIWVCLLLSAPIDSFLQGGDYRLWLYDAWGLTYDQRNALVVGFALGFAAIPIIFTISEDALSSVPRHLISGSLALGANRWQTTVKVVLPTASAAIFSAVMIGLGRIVGETMIVLMATGNTPLMDWNLFNGFRALSANIAVEMPEAPFGGTLYRVLFVAAFLLFMLTFTVNTLAEMVRMKLRKKYGDL